MMKDFVTADQRLEGLIIVKARKGGFRAFLRWLITVSNAAIFVFLMTLPVR